MPDFKVSIRPNGPYVVTGGVPLSRQHIVTNDAGESLEWAQGESFDTGAVYALCRCGQSSKKPFCDGSHVAARFDGTETASRAPYDEQAGVLEGPEMALQDAESLCAFARFCDPEGRVWNLVQETQDPRARALVEHEAGHCPAGRLVARNRAGEALEPKHSPSIGLVMDTARGESGPIWVRGGIPVVSADGTTYEVRNRVTLCRCGASDNKPFCNGAHASMHFKE